MYTSIRRYKLAAGADVEQLISQINEQFVPALLQTPGFKSYCVVGADDGVVATISVFEDETGAEASNQLAADYVRENVAPLIEGPPEITQGGVLVRVE